jgi:hypothetical protein
MDNKSQILTAYSRYKGEVGLRMGGKFDNEKTLHCGFSAIVFGRVIQYN